MDHEFLWLKNITYENTNSICALIFHKDGDIYIQTLIETFKFKDCEETYNKCWVLYKHEPKERRANG